MNAAARLLGFAALLIGVFAAAAFAGSRVDVDRGEEKAGHQRPDSREDHAMSDTPTTGHAEHAGTTADPVRGLTASEGGLTLKLARTSAPRAQRFDLAFRIVDAEGTTVRDFEVEHTKRMHLIVVRRDLTGFQHLHPEQAADGSWSTPVTLADAGTYRVFADFSSGGEPRTLAEDLSVDGDVESRPLPPPADAVTVDALKVALASGGAHPGQDAELGFTVTRDGKPVAVEPYLGARGHLVALRDGDLAFLHVHPEADALSFMARFPTAGRYRLFLQFQTEGRVHTAAFTEEVPE